MRDTPPDHVIVELSGVADPTRLTGHANSDGFRLDSIVVLVDLEQIDAQLDDPLIGPIVRRQLDAADLFLLSKTQLVSESRVVTIRDHLAGIAPGTPTLDISDAADGAAFLDLGTRRPGGSADIPQPQLFDPPETSIKVLPAPISRSDVESLLEGLPSNVVRAKGIAVDPAGRRLLIQVVGRRRLVTELPQAEDQPSTDLVVITARGPATRP